MTADVKEFQHLRAGIRQWLLRAARNGRLQLRGLPAPAILSLLTAAAFAPVLATAAGLASGTAFAGIGVLSSVGGGVLGDFLTGALERIRSSDAGRAISLDSLEQEIARGIREILARQDAHADEMRSDIAMVLREIDVGGTVLRAAIETGDSDLQREVLAAVETLSTGFSDMGFLLAGLARAAGEIQESLSSQAPQLRAITAQVGRQSADVRMIREELTVIDQRMRAWIPGSANAPNPVLPWMDGCPYRGLLPYDQAHEAVFYGRERLTAELAGELINAGMVMVTGASGAGKSSLLQAGLLPALARGVQVPGSASWPRMTTTPTEHPLAELAAHLALLASRDPNEIRRNLSEAPCDAHLLVRELMLAAAGREQLYRGPVMNHRLVLVIDQFEQVFDLTGEEGERERAAFIEAISAAATRPAGPQNEPPALLAVAVRGDYWDRCATYPQLLRVMQQDQFVVGPMTTTDLRLVITGPAEASGLDIEPALTDVILADLRSVGGDQGTGTLPLLSQAMMLTWEKREGNRLTSRGYMATGGVARAVEVGAEAVYDGLPADQKVIARDVLRRMTAVGSDRRSVRRTVRLEDLRVGRPADEWPQVDAVLEAFAKRRLLVLGAGTAEIGHDVLLQAWPRLRGWLEEDQASLILHGQLAEDAEQWSKNGRDSSFLYRGAQLGAVTQAARTWEEDPGRYPSLNANEAGFLHASNVAATRAGRRRRMLAAALVLLLIAAVTGAGIAAKAARTAEQQRTTAISGRLAAQSVALDGTDPVTASLLAAAAWRLAPTPQARYSMLEALAQPSRGTMTANWGGVFSMSYSPVGGVLAAGYRSGAMGLWDVPSRRLIRSIPLTGKIVLAVAFADHGKVLKAAIPGALVTFTASKGKVSTWPLGPTDSSAAAFSPDSRTLAVAYLDGTVRLWNASTRQRIGKLILGSGSASGPVVLAFSPDGSALAVGNQDGTVQLWNLAAHSQIGSTIDAHATLIALAFSPDGRSLATGDANGKARLWAVATQSQIGSAVNTRSIVRALAFCLGGTVLATAGADGVTRLWNVAARDRTGASLSDPTQRGTSSIAVSPSGDVLLTGNNDGTIRLWNPSTFQQVSSPLAVSVLQHPADIIDSGGPVFSADREFLATSGNGIQLWDVTRRRSVGLPTSPSNGPPALAVSGDGRMVATADRAVELWDVRNGRRLGRSIAISDPLEMAFSPDGRLLAVGRSNGQAELWSVGDRRRVGAPMTMEKGRNAIPVALTFSPDGTLLVTNSSDGRTRLWDVATQHQVGASMIGDGQAVEAEAFSPDGKELAIASSRGTTRLWDVATQQQIGAPMAGPATIVNSVAFSPDGTMLATASSDGNIRVWDVATQQEIGSPLSADTLPVDAVAFSPDGKKLMAASTDQTVRMWNVAFPADLLRGICAIAGQSLTRQQWADYVGAQPYQQVCPAS